MKIQHAALAVAVGLLIAAQCTPPVPPPGGGGALRITTEPADQVASPGQTARFRVAADGGTGAIVYRWQRNGADVSGATSAILEIGPVGPSDHGTRVRCIVTDGATTVASQEAMLVVGAGGADPVRVSSDRHLLERGGRRLLLIGDSVTQGWQELGTDFDQRAYVEALGRRGINLLMLWTYIGIENQAGDARIGYDAPEVWPWVRSGGGFDLRRLDEAYFRRLEALVQLAAGRGIVVLVTVHDGGVKWRFGGHPFNARLGGPLTDKGQYVELATPGREMPSSPGSGWSRQQWNQWIQERFCDRLIRAIGDEPNVVFEMFNEGEWYDRSKLAAHQRHFLAFFKRRTDQPTMVNDDHVGSVFRGESSCDILSWHRPNWGASTTPGDAFGPFAGAFHASPAKPLLFSEPVPEYQGDSRTHDGLMRLMWGTALAGAGFVVQNDTSFGFAPRAAIAREAADRDRVLDLEGHCARFFNASGIDLEGMVPDSRWASSKVCLARPGKEYVAYSASGATLTMNLSQASGALTGRWYDPRTGRFGSPFSVAGGSSSVGLAKPSSSDWVLHLEAGAGAPPGSGGGGHRPILERGDGFLWKPASEKDKKLVVLLPKSMAGGQIARVVVASDPTGVTLLRDGEGKEYPDYHDGRALWRFSRAGADYGNGVYLVVHFKRGLPQPYRIRRGADRQE